MNRRTFFAAVAALPLVPAAQPLPGLDPSCRALDVWLRAQEEGTTVLKDRAGKHAAGAWDSAKADFKIMAWEEGFNREEVAAYFSVLTF